MKTLYFDCFSGMSGDMVIGALIDAGADPEHMMEALKKLHIEDEYELKWDKVIKNGITSTKFDVILNDDHADKHKHDHHSDSEHHEHGHNHTHSHGHSHHNHDHHHRTYTSIVKMIKAAAFSASVETMALNIFKKIGESEGRIHGLPLGDVHFHEVGAVDSIIDIVGAAILMDQLNVDKITCAHIPVGSGHIHIDHGIYPVPAPATLDILRGVPISRSDIKSELTTPTGAAIAAVLANDFGTLPTMTVTSIGYGAGTKTFPDHPNVLRVVLGEMV